ncbi:ankyrin [Piromyces finnis]|uniref:Ankyrin n=1 Tax=Piromyces finnis TaxID=1754191 RepID=A0A1Y1UY84_9FUNG|nr:ankyrin [Piromyces finnis]|eukprot:ORX43245.1 ankyrin [Piromyces finnis]
MEVENNSEFKLPDICIKKYKKNTSKENKLINAVSTGNIKDIYDILWNENVSPQVKKDFYGSDLITIATQNNQNDLVKLFMKMNLDPHNPNNYGTTPIHWAANNGNDSIIKELCNHGLTVRDLEKRDQFGSTPLHFAAMKNNESVVQLLISSGINPTVINNDGMRASDVTTDISIKRYLKEEENRYMAEHFKKKGKRKGKKKKGSGKSRSLSSSKSNSAPSRKASTVKQSSIVKSVSTVKPKKNTSVSSKKNSISSVLPPEIPSYKSVVASRLRKQILNPTSYAMKNFNDDVITLDNSSKSLKGSKSNSPKSSTESIKQKNSL